MLRYFAFVSIALLLLGLSLRMYWHTLLWIAGWMVD